MPGKPSTVGFFPPEASSQATLPHVLCVLATLIFYQAPDLAGLSLNSGYLHALFLLLGLLFICLHITSGKSWVGLPGHTPLIRQLLHKVCELQERGTGLALFPIYPQGPAHHYWVGECAQIAGASPGWESGLGLWLLPHPGAKDGEPEAEPGVQRARTEKSLWLHPPFSGLDFIYKMGGLAISIGVWRLCLFVCLFFQLPNPFLK